MCARLAFHSNANVGLVRIADIDERRSEGPVPARCCALHECRRRSLQADLTRATLSPLDVQPQVSRRLALPTSRAMV